MIEKRPIASRESSQEEATKKKSRRGLESLARTVSPPPKNRRQQNRKAEKSVAAAIEAGEKDVQDHVAFYSSHLLKVIRPQLPGQSRITHEAWVQLYNSNAGSVHGSHFVVHQHDHPVAGTHYDLRLQCNPTSSISFAIPYGLPGNPNSRRLNRNAIETRVHCLWNHLIETASHSTGSMLIWDTGQYEVLPYHETSGDVTDDDLDIVSNTADVTQQDKLRDAFQKRKVKLRLHGTRLPSGYTISLRLTKENFRTEQPGKPARRRKRKAPRERRTPQTDESGDESGVPSLQTPPASASREAENEDTTSGNAAVASDDENEIIRANNAYTGATNDIGSVHQRRWFMSIDRRASGFAKVTKTSSGFTETWWKRTTEDKLVNGTIGAPSGFEPFVVGGRNSERSIVTGRLAGEILGDEGVIGYVPRGLWRPVTE